MQNTRHKYSDAFGLNLDKFNYNCVAVLYTTKRFFLSLKTYQSVHPFMTFVKKCKQYNGPQVDTLGLWITRIHICCCRIS